MSQPDELPAPQPGALPGSARERRVNALAFWACCAVAIAPLWVTTYPPMVDVAQHAAQVSIWMNLDDPAFGFADQFQLNWFSPYLLGYVLTGAIASVTGVLVALKIVLSLAVIGLPLSMRTLLARTGGDPWWALLGLPISFGASFYWGFLNFLVAVPFGILFVAQAHGYAAGPTRRRAGWLAIFATILFFAHALVFGAAVLTAGCLIAVRAPGVRAIFVRASPLLGPVAVAIFWMALTRGREAQAAQPVLWELGLARLTGLHEELLGCPTDLPHPANREALFGLLALAGAAAVTIGGVARELHRWVPLLLAVLLYGFAPRAVLGAFLVNARFAIFIVPFALIALAPTASRSRLRVGRTLLAVAVLGWSVLLTQRFRAFDAEAADFRAAASRIPQNRAVLGLVFVPTSAVAPGYPYLHFPAWYQVEKGGRLGFSFAYHYPELVRYRPGKMPRTTRESLVWDPQTFMPGFDDWGFEYFLVRSPTDFGRALFPSDGRTERLAHEGTWWLYRRGGGSR